MCLGAAGGPGSVQGVEGSSGLHQGLRMGESTRLTSAAPLTPDTKREPAAPTQLQTSV